MSLSLTQRHGELCRLCANRGAGPTRRAPRVYRRCVPYPNRSTFPPGAYHLVDRATGGIALFRDVQDRQMLLSLFGFIVKREQWTCLAYCLMSTHWHFVIETPSELSRGMQWLKSMYARGFNERHGRFGALFQKRFWSGPIESEEQLERVVVYVTHNPVRAGLCQEAHEWRWSGGTLSGLDP
jgi:putative transposase